jgi:hypothetical protein
MMRWVKHVVLIGEKKNAYTVLVRELKERRLAGKYRHIWEDNIIVDLEETG